MRAQRNSKNCQVISKRLFCDICLDKLKGTKNGMSFDALDENNQVIERLLETIKKNNKIVDVYERWMRLETRSGGVYQFILDNGFRKVAIYGMGNLGRSLCDELSHNQVEVVYVIDKNKSINCSGYQCYTMQDELPEADVVIITPITYFEEISKELSKKLTCPLLSLDDIIP